MIEKINESNLIGEHQNKSISTILDKINEIIDYINPKEIEEKCDHSFFPCFSSGACKMKPVYQEENQDWDIRFDKIWFNSKYPSDVRPKLLELFFQELQSCKEQRTKEIIEKIENHYNSWADKEELIELIKE